MSVVLLDVLSRARAPWGALNFPCVCNRDRVAEKSGDNSDEGQDGIWIRIN